MNVQASSATVTLLVWGVDASRVAAVGLVVLRALDTGPTLGLACSEVVQKLYKCAIDRARAVSRC